MTIKQTAPLVFILAFVALSGCSRQTESTWSTPGEYAAFTDDVEYVGIETCGSCHAEQYETYVQAEMGRSFRKASLANSDADFENAEAIYDAGANLYYQAFHSGEELFLKEFRLNGRDTVYIRTEQIDYIVGSGQHTNSHIMDENGFLYQMPITWYSQDRKWDLPPKYRQLNYRFSRPIPQPCMTCHNAKSDFVEGSENRFASVPHGIDCERCHGPGSAHVEKINAGDITDVENEIDYSIVHPGKLPVDRQFNICQGCHMQGAAVNKPGMVSDDFRPGMRLADVQNVFWPRTSDSVNTFIMASHPDRLQMSECFTGSHDESSPVAPLTCTTCHNTHVSIKTLGPEHYNDACQSCHSVPETTECSEPLSAREAVGNNCVSCHMPSSGSSDIPHVQITDHFIRPLRASDQRAVTAGEVESQVTTYALASLIEDNPSDQEIAEGFLTYFEEKTNQPGFVDSAIVYLRKAESKGIRRQDLAPTWIRAWFWNRDHGQIKDLASRISLADVQDPWTHYRVGEAYLSTEEAEASIAHFERAVELAPYHLRFLDKLASGYTANGDAIKAIGIYDRILDLNPKYESAYNNRGFARLVTSDFDGAESDFRKSLSLFPDGVNALANLASLYYNTGRGDEAIELMDRLLVIDPTNQQYISFRRVIVES